MKRTRDTAWRPGKIAVTVLFSTMPALLAQAPSVQVSGTPSPRKVQQAADAYLAGAKALRDNHPAEAETDFTRATQLDPTRPDYVRALQVAKEHHVSQLVQAGARERLLGHNAEADTLFAEAQRLDPDNALVAEHLQQPALAAPFYNSAPIPPEALDLAQLGGAIELAPTAGKHTLHSRGDAQSVLREVYSTWGIHADFDPSLSSRPIHLDLEDVDFRTATRTALLLAGAFATPLTSKQVLLAKETPENRDRLAERVEETVFLPGYPIDQLNELSNIAKTVFDIKQVSVVQNGQALVLRGPNDALRLVNTTFATLLDGGDDVMLDVKLFEVDSTRTRNLGVNLPSSAGVISITGAASSIVSQNSTLLAELEAVEPALATAGILAQAAALIAAGATTTALSGLLGTIGSFSGLPLAGVYLGSNITLNALLSATDVRLVDAVQIRVGEKQLGTFRVGSRYPVVTSQYSSGLTAAQTSQLSGLTVNGQSVASLLNSLTSAQVPVFQYEDLGLTLKATPQVEKSGNVAIQLEMKIEALTGATINSIPILNSRQITSNIVVPDGGTALVGSNISRNESHAIQGIPLLSEIPGLGTERNSENDRTDLLITVTPHVVRKRSPIVATRRILANLAPTGDD